MKLLKLFPCLVLLFVHLFISSAHAQAPTAFVPIPEALKPTCGYADIEGSNACCSKLPLSSSISVVTGVFQSIPLFGGAVTGIIDTIVTTLLPETPLFQQFDVQCRLGNPKVDLKTKSCTCTSEALAPAPTPIVTGYPQLVKLCKKYENQIERIGCERCANDGGILTGIGCVPTNYSKFISEFLFRVGIGFGGLFSLGCIIFAAIQIQTSAGDAEKISKAQDQIKACMLGLLLIIFSILLLKIIGVNILGIPGFI